MRTVKRIAAYAAAILLFFSVTLSLFMTMSLAELTRIPDLAERITDKEYMDIMSSAVAARVKTTLALSVIEPDDIADLLEGDSIRTEAEKALKMSLCALIGHGNDDEKYTFESSGLRERTEAVLSEYAEENGIELDPASTEETYSAIAASVGSELSVIAAAYTNKIAPYAQKLERMLKLWYIPVLLSAVLVAVIVILRRKHTYSASLLVLTPMYFSSFILCVLINILKSRDYLSNTVISGGTLTLTLQRIYYYIFDEMCTVTLVLTVALAVLITATIAGMAMKPYIRSHKRKQRS